MGDVSVFVTGATGSVIAFGATAMHQWAQYHGLPRGHLHPEHYDILARAGARMDDFTRAEVATL